MDKKFQQLVSLKFIRIAKDFSREEFSKYFLCTMSYISAVELGKRSMHMRTIESGLRKMEISFDDYLQLEKLKETLINLNIDEEFAYRCMLAKSIGIVNPDLKEQAELLVTQILNKKSKQR